MNEKVMIGTWAWGPGQNGSKMVFGQSYDEQILKDAFDRSVSLGFLDWDTAAVYGMGSCERLLGGFMKGRDDIYLSTKFMPGGRYKKGALTESFNQSMERLGRTYADLFWIHRPSNLIPNLKEAIPLIKEGKIKSIGISNVSLDHIKQAEQLLASEGLKLGAVQNHFSLIRGDQQPIIDYCNKNGIRYYAYMVLEQGALAGRYSAKNHFPTFSFRNFMFPKRKFKKIEGLLETMKKMAEELDIDRSQIPILWAIGKGAIPIVGITKARYADELAKALKVELTKEQIDKLTNEAISTGLRQQGVWEPQ